MQITVLNTTKSTATNAIGKPYQKLEVAYKDSFGKVMSKLLLPFGDQKAAFDSLESAQVNSVFTITVIKNAKGYNDWVSAVQAPPGTVASLADAAKQPASTAVSVKSNYETPEERAKRQILIVRQSSLSTAATVLSIGAKSVPTPDSVIALAETFYAWVMKDPELVTAQDVFKLDNDIEVL